MEFIIRFIKDGKFDLEGYLNEMFLNGGAN